MQMLNGNNHLFIVIFSTCHTLASKTSFASQTYICFDWIIGNFRDYNVNVGSDCLWPECSPIHDKLCQKMTIFLTSPVTFANMVSNWTTSFENVGLSVGWYDQQSLIIVYLQEYNNWFRKIIIRYLTIWRKKKYKEVVLLQLHFWGTFGWFVHSITTLKQF